MEIKFYVISFLLIAGYLLSANQVYAANEYLNSGGGHCSTGSIEPYFDYSIRDRVQVGRGVPRNSLAEVSRNSIVIVYTFMGFCQMLFLWWGNIFAFFTYCRELLT